jgi:hypothetical protein
VLPQSVAITISNLIKQSISPSPKKDQDLEFTCELKGGKEACSYKSKDAIACIILRNCEHVKITNKEEEK